MNSDNLKGTPLHDLLCNPEFQLSEVGFCYFLIDITGCLWKLWERKVIFSDLHLSDIYRSPDGTYKIDCAENSKNKYYDSFYGENNPWFMPPELYRKLKFNRYYDDFDETAAVYEIGLIAHFLLNDFVPPFWEKLGSPALLVRMDGLQEIPAPKRLQNSSVFFKSILARIINVALQHDRKKRQPSLNALMQEIEVACTYCEGHYLFIKGGFPDEIRDENKFDCINNVESDYLWKLRLERERQFCPDPQELSYRNFDKRLADQHIQTLEGVVDNERKHSNELYRKIVEANSAIQSLNSSTEQIRQEKTILEEEVESLKHKLAELRKNTSDWYPFIPRIEKSSIWSRLFGNRNKPQSVYSSVFAPAEIAPKQHLLVQVYLHLPEETEKVKALASEADKSAERRGYEPLEVPLKKGDNVEIELNVNGDSLLYNCRKSVVWQGAFVKRAFDFVVPADINVYELSNSVNIYVNGAIAGELIFLTAIVDSPRQLNTNVYARPTKKLFISYSHKDIASAEKIAKIHEALGIDVFFDKHRLKAGYIYSEEISEFIQNADTFVLCWSENAAKSDYVKKERQEALALAYPQSKPRERARLRIHPYNIEPYADLPADMIEHYHFEEL